MIHSTARVTTRELAQEASLISTMSTGDMMGAIETFLTIIPKELAKGKIEFVKDPQQPPKPEPEPEE